MDASSITEVKDCCAAPLEALNAKKILKRVITQHIPSEEKVLNATIRNAYAETHGRRDGQNKNGRRNKDYENDVMGAMPGQITRNQAANDCNDSRGHSEKEANESDSGNYARSVAVFHNATMVSYLNGC